MPISIREKLVLARRESKLTQQQLADRIGVDMQTYSRWERGVIKKIPTEALEKIATATNKPLSYFLPEEPHAIEIKDIKIPVVTLAKASDEKGFEFAQLEPYEYEYIDFKNCKAIKITSNSMAPIAYAGQKIIYSEIEHIEDGDLVFVRLKTGEQYFKRYFNHEKKVVTLVSVNNAEPRKPHIKKREEIEFMYRVVGVKF